MHELLEVALRGRGAVGRAPDLRVPTRAGGSARPRDLYDFDRAVDLVRIATSFNRSAMRPSTLKFPERKATICEKSLRTVNTNAECGAPDDFWYHHPWRYPGSAPVIDSCGSAGGRRSRASRRSPGTPSPARRRAR